MSTPAIDSQKNYAASAMSVLRMFAGGIGWASPAHSWRLFGLGRIPDDGSAGLATRLFGIRDLILGAGIHHPDPAVRTAVLRAGVLIDSVDVLASLLAVRAGAPKASLLGVAAGAGLFVGMGVTALSGNR